MAKKKQPTPEEAEKQLDAYLKEDTNWQVIKTEMKRLRQELTVLKYDGC